MSIIINSIFKTLGFVISVVIIILFAIFFMSIFKSENSNSFSFLDGNKESKNIIAILKLDGLIIEKKRNVPKIASLNIISPSNVKKNLHELSNHSPKILIISINSPGGTVSASKNLYDIISDYKKSEKIEVIFHTNELLASGAYWASLSGDKIFASYGSIIGSIGVKGPDWFYYNEPKSISTGIFGTSIDTNKGIKVFSQTAGKSKDLLNPFREPRSEELKHFKNMVKEIYDDFVRIVSKERNIEINTIVNDIGALIYTSKEAENIFLIDGEENLDNLIKKMIKEKGYDDYKLIQKNYQKNTLFQDLMTGNINILKNINNYNNFTCLSLRSSLSVILNHHSAGC